MHIQRCMACLVILGGLSAAGAQGFNSETTEMPGEVYDSNEDGTVVSATTGMWAAPHVFWSDDNGTSWVEINSPPIDGHHHVPLDIDLRSDKTVTLWVNIGTWGWESPPKLNWHRTFTWTNNRGATWGDWHTEPPGPASARDWNLFE